MPIDDFNILFTCSGRRVALLDSFRAAKTQLGVGGKIIATDITPASAALHKADLGLVVPMVDHDKYVPTLLEQVRRHRVKLLVPLTDIDLLPLAHHREEFLAAGCTIMIGSEQAVTICRDKDQTHRLLEAGRLPTIRTLSLEEFRGKPFYPCFIKPIRGSASVGSAILHSTKELREHVAVYGERLIVQEYLSGQEYTLDVYRSRDGVVRCVVPRQRLVVRSGEAEKAVTVRDDELIAATCKVAALVDLWGVFCCQCRRDNDGGPPRFFEINPRFGGGAPLSIAAGADLPLYLLQEVLGLPITAELGRYQENLLMLRYDDAVFTPVDQLHDLPGFQSPQIR